MKRGLVALTGLALAGCSEAPSCPSADPFPLPPLTGRVVDNAGLLTPARKDKLSVALADTERLTRHQFVVVTVPSLHGRAIEDVGLMLGKCWGIGRKDHDDGVLLIVAPTERKVRIEVGYGLERTLTDSEAKAIIDQQILPSFKRRELAAGIFRGSAAIIREIDDLGATP